MSFQPLQMQIINSLAFQLEAMHYRSPLDFVTLRLMVLEIIHHLMRLLVTYKDRLNLHQVLRITDKLNAIYEVIDRQPVNKYAFTETKAELLSCVYAIK